MNIIDILPRFGGISYHMFNISYQYQIHLNFKVSFSSFFLMDSFTSLSLKLNMSFLKVYSYISFVFFIACSHLGLIFSMNSLGIYCTSWSGEYFHLPILDITMSSNFFLSFVDLVSYLNVLKFTMLTP